MLTLLIDTCTERGLVAIFNGTQTLFIEELPLGLQSSSLLLPTLDNALKLLKLDIAAIQLVVVASGPGSYTGIRVGVSAAKALVFVHHQPLVAVSTLHGLIPEADGFFAGLIDAKIGGAYYMLGRRSGKDIEYLSGPTVAPLEEIIKIIPADHVLVTPVASALKEKLHKLAPDSSWQWQEKGPDATQMINIGLQKYEKGEFTLDGQIDILYLRKTQAEIEKERRD